MVTVIYSKWSQKVLKSLIDRYTYVSIFYIESPYEVVYDVKSIYFESVVPHYYNDFIINSVIDTK